MVKFSFNCTLAQLMKVKAQNLQFKIFAAYSHSLTYWYHVIRPIFLFEQEEIYHFV